MTRRLSPELLMNELDKLSILKLATGTFFTDLPSFCDKIFNEIGNYKCTRAEIEEFLEGTIDFNHINGGPEFANEHVSAFER